MIEAVKSLKIRFENFKKYAEVGNGFIAPTLYESDMEIIIQALEKQIPKKPIDFMGLRNGDYCPRCRKRADEYIDDYCKECGQKLDWSK